MSVSADKIKTFKWRCSVLRAAGLNVQETTKKDFLGLRFTAIVKKDSKIYHFADPCLDTINAQLGKLIQNVALHCNK